MTTDLWTILIRSWLTTLKAENKSNATIRVYTCAAEQLAAWCGQLAEPVDPTEVDAGHLRGFITHLMERASPGNAIPNTGA